MAKKQSTLFTEYLHQAWDVLEACQVLDRSARKKVPQDITLSKFYKTHQYLIGHALELLLKSALSKNETSEKDLRKINHDLKEAYKLCLKKSIQFPSEIYNLIEIFYKNHKNQDFRYSKIFDGFDPKNITVYSFCNTTKAIKVIKSQLILLGKK